MPRLRCVTVKKKDNVISINQLTLQKSDIDKSVNITRRLSKLTATDQLAGYITRIRNGLIQLTLLTTATFLCSLQRCGVYGNAGNILTCN